MQVTSGWDDRAIGENRSKRIIRYTNRFLCYFDLLGFTRLVEHGDIDDILPTYNGVLETLRDGDCGINATVRSAWFSDTFVMFTLAGTARDFAAIESRARLFFERLLLR